MIKVLILSDDFTGALDTGIQFAQYGVKTRIVPKYELDFIIDNKDLDVLIINLETRHLTSKEAYDIVFDVVSKGEKAGVKCIYKKTDSGLRGNIGSELGALLEASGELFLPFIPALPNMNRFTKEGIHYMEGIPIEHSAFGQDPYSPVVHSRVKKLFDTSTVEVVEIEKANKYNTNFEKNTIGIFDAETNEDMLAIAKHLQGKNQLNILAGCAGFASVLPQIFGIKEISKKLPNINMPLLIVCGSINPITKKQIEFGEQIGFKRIIMEHNQLLSADYLNTKEGIDWIKDMNSLMKQEEVIMLETGISRPRHTTANASNKENERLQLSKGLMGLVGKILRDNQLDIIMIIGGDTLMEFFKQNNCSEIELICEIEPGNVLSKIKLNDRNMYLISKSGGFGNENQLQSLYNKTKLMDKTS